jgi:hypothetical protein
MEEETHQYETGSWRTDEAALPREAYLSQPHDIEPVDRDVRDRSRLLFLLGLINYKILTGKRVYVEVGGIVYRTLYGGYWRSVFTGVEHYLLRCQEISGGMWTEGGTSVGMVDLPITHTKEGWAAKGHSLMFMLHRD